jgi:predicted phage terminase large subunit-like protein
MALTQREFEREYGELIGRIQKKATAFPHDSTERKLARKKRAEADKFFFAATYFPHYIQLRDEDREPWHDPSARVDWVRAGFAICHEEFFKAADLLQTFTILAAFRESAKDTLLGKIDVLHKMLFGTRWFIPVVAKTEEKAETKCVPVKLELETNLRLRNDFGDETGSVEWEFGSFITRSGRKMKGYGREQSLRGEENFGHRPDHIILNDVSDPTKPDSPGLVQKFTDSVKEDILMSVNSPRWSAIFLCNYTIKGDVIDALMTGKHTSHYNKKIFRALVPNELATRDDRAIARACREAGYPTELKSAWEFRHPTLALLKERSNDPETFATERMMQPRSRKDQKFKDNYFRFHTRDEITPAAYVFYTYVDPSAKDAADYKAVITVGMGFRGEMPHIPIVRASIQQQSVDEMLRETYRQRQAFRSKLVGVETNGFQILLKKEYMRLQKQYGLLPFQEVEHTGESKESRVERIVPFVKEGIVTFDLEDPDQLILVDQLKAFPNAGEVAKGGLGDDGPDALAGAVELVEIYQHAGEVRYESVQRRLSSFRAGAF